MKKIIAFFFSALFVFIPYGTVNANEIQAPTQMTVEQKVEIRKGASSKYPVVKTLFKHQQVTIIEEFKNSLGEKWYRVDLGKIIGWGKAEHFSFKTINLVNKLARVTESDVDVRKGATANYQSIGKLKRNQIVKVIDKFENNSGQLWYRIEFGNLKGWVFGAYLIDAESTSPIPPFQETVQVQSVLVRKGAMNSYPSVSTLKKNQQVKIIDVFQNSEGEEWFRVDLGFLKGWVPSSAFVPVQQKTVQVYNAVVRKGASTSYAIVTTLKINQKVEIIDEFTHNNGDKWYRINLGNVKGWVHKSVFEIPKNVKTVLANIEYVRKGASPSYAIVSEVVKNQNVHVIDTFTHKNGDIWYRIDLGTIKGWVPSSAFVPVQQKTVQVYNAVVRKGASTSYAIVTTLKINQKVEIIDEFTHNNGDKWYRINLGNVKGWVHKSVFEIPENVKTVLANTAHVRRGASTTYASIAKVIKNQKVHVIDSFVHENGEKWYRIDLGTVKGWVPETIFQPQPAFQKGTVIIATKNAVLRSGASTAYKILEKNIPYNTKAQAIDEFINPSTGQRWIRIITSSGNTGWVQEYEVVNNLSELKYIYALKKGVLRKSASSNADSVHTLRGDEKLIFLDETNNWFLVETSDGYRGWILRDFTAQTIIKKLLSPSLLISDSVETLVWKKSMNFELSYTTLSNYQLKIFGNISSVEIPNFKINGIKSIMYNNSDKSIVVTFEQGYTFTTKNNDGTLSIKAIPKGIKGKKIIIDAGHGGHDPGAIGPSGVKEKDINLAISKLLKSELEKLGAVVVLTRDQDYFLQLSERTDIANMSDFDAFISIHCDSYLSTSQGTTTFYNNRVNYNGPKSIQLAQVVQKNLINAIGTTNRGVQEQEFYVNRMNELPSILVEVAFISNPREETLLKSSTFQQKAAKGIATGIKEYFNNF